VVRGGVLVTLNDADDVVVDGVVVVEDDRIAAVGPASELARGSWASGARVIDASGMAVLPGLVDLHFHTALTRGYRDDLPLWEALQEVWYPMIRALDPETAYWGALASYAEAIKAGTTTVNDMFRQVEALADAAEQIGLRCVLSNDVADPEHGLDTLEDAERAFHRRHGAAGGRVQVVVGIEWLPLASPQLLVEARALADRLGTGIHVHLNESQGEVDLCLERFGRRPTELSYDCGLLGPDCVAAHCVWLSDAEIALMRETGTHISHNPKSNAKLGNGVARLPEMLAAGINVGLGHDAAEGNNNADMFETMKWASLVHRATRVDASLGQPSQILRMATRNGARALGHDTGELAPGRKADLILVDLGSQMFTPLRRGDRDHLYSHLVFAANGSCVDTTIVEGRVLMQGRRLLTVDEDEVLAKANEAFARVLERMVVPGTA
jgi:5-methylthioadenosine/S-adenosylhomocysteine deaminase